MGASADIPDAFFTQLIQGAALRGWNPEFMTRVMMSESGLSTTAGHTARGLIQWEPPYPGGSLEALEAKGFVGQLQEAFKWWDEFEEGKPYQTLGDFYAAVFLPGRRIHPLSSGALTQRGESFYDNNPLLDPDHTGSVTENTLAQFASRSAVVNSARYQDVLARLQALGVDLSSGTENAGVGPFPWLVVGTLMLLGVGGTMLLGQAKVVRLPKWLPAWVRT